MSAFDPLRTLCFAHHWHARALAAAIFWIKSTFLPVDPVASIVGAMELSPAFALGFEGSPDRSCSYDGSLAHEANAKPESIRNQIIRD
jgi:hypothetical protein